LLINPQNAVYSFLFQVERDTDCNLHRNASRST